MSSLNSFSSHNLSTGNPSNTSSSDNSSSSSPISSNLLVNTNGPIVKTIAKTFESASTNSLLPNYHKPKIFTSTLTKIFGEDKSKTKLQQLSKKNEITRNENKVKRNESHEPASGLIVGRIQNEASVNGSQETGQVSPVSISSSSSTSSSSCMSLDSSFQDKTKCGDIQYSMK